jgi:hypothetical protein
LQQQAPQKEEPAQKEQRRRKRRDIEVRFIDGIPSRELRTRTKLFYHCHRAQLIPPLEYQAYLNYINHDPNQTNGDNNHKSTDDTNWTSCFDGIPIDTEHRKGSTTDRSLPYCVELWRKVKTINRGRSVLACLLVHLIALHILTTEQYDILLEDNVRCDCSNDTSFLDQIQAIIDATTNNNNNNDVSNSNCHMRYYGWLGSIPNLHWIYNTYIPQYIQKKNANTTSNMTMVPCPIPSDIEPHPTDETVYSKWIPEISTKNEDHENDTVQDEFDEVVLVQEEEEDDVLSEDVRGIQTQFTSSVSLTTPTIPPPQPPKVQPMVTPGGTNLVWGTYAYWISSDAYRIILQTLQNDIGAIVWKGKRMRYYHVKPIDKVIPRIIRNHFGTAHHNTDTTTGSMVASSSSSSSASTSCIQIPIRPIFFRAPMLSSNIHTKWDAQFCLSTHYQMQQMSSVSISSLLSATTTTTTTTTTTNNATTATSNTVSSYHDIFLSDTEQMVVEHARKHDYTVWKTPKEISIAADSTIHTK